MNTMKNVRFAKRICNFIDSVTNPWDCDLDAKEKLESTLVCFRNPEYIQTMIEEIRGYIDDMSSDPGYWAADLEEGKAILSILCSIHR